MFKYLGQLISMDDDDAQAVRARLTKARAIWSMLSKVLRTENATPRVCGMFYHATVQAVLLYGSETWVMLQASLRMLEGFHIHCVRRMTDLMPRKRRDGTWKYSKSTGVLTAASLRTIDEYVAVRRQTAANYIANWPIFAMCEGMGRRRGTKPRQYWWEQPFHLADMRAVAPEKA